MTIPALSTIVDRQFKEDRTVCLVRALYYLDRTKDLRMSRSLLFISFKKGHTSDIRPATLSSWLKQTILLCYKQADQQALDLVEVKAHDIKAFVASEASVGYRWTKSSKRVTGKLTLFYLKDLTWSDNKQQYVPGTSSSGTTSPSPFPSAYSSSGRKQGGGGGGGGGGRGAHPRQPSLQESIPGSRYWFPLQMFMVRSLYIFNCIMYLVFASVPKCHI